MVKIITKELLAPEVQKPRAKFRDGVQLKEHMRTFDQGKPENPQTVVEFIGTDNFAAEWYERQRFEVEAGRAEEPLLYGSIYSEVSDASLPRNVTVHKLGPAGVIFSEITEGGEVKFATVGESSYSIPIKHYGVGLEYNKDLVIYNELWRLSIVEREAGMAYNALLNHLHFAPILTYAYTAANQTAAHVDAAMGRTELWLRTLEDAIVNSVTDTTNPRRGPYDLIVSTSDLFSLEWAMQRRMQDGIDVRSSAISRVQNIIAYDGWSGTRGNKTISYAGVTAGKAYLVSKQYRAQDFQSFEKQPLQSDSGNPDVSRFILEQVVWDFYRGVYANPIAAVEEITWPS